MSLTYLLGFGSPARAGIAPGTGSGAETGGWLPRPRGDSPYLITHATKRDAGGGCTLVVPK